MVLCLVPYFLRSPRQPSCKQMNARNYGQRPVFRPACVFRPRILPSASAEATGLRVFVVSDLHTDYSENMTWVRELSRERYKNDVLLVAGDVAETYTNFELTMSLLKDRFEHVFYVPGNHDLWCRHVDQRYVSSIYCPYLVCRYDFNQFMHLYGPKPGTWSWLGMAFVLSELFELHFLEDIRM